MIREYEQLGASRRRQIGNDRSNIATTDTIVQSTCFRIAAVIVPGIAAALGILRTHD
jgi:hypothetical protein